MLQIFIQATKNSIEKTFLVKNFLSGRILLLLDENETFFNRKEFLFLSRSLIECQHESFF